MSKNKKHNKEKLKKLLDRMSNPKKVLKSPKVISGKKLLCSGQQILATLLEFPQNSRSATFGANPSLCR